MRRRALTVVGGMLLFRGDGVRDVLRRLRDLAARSPRDLSCQAVLWADESTAPSLGVFPCYSGSASDPAELRALQSAPGLIDDTVREHSFLDQQLVIDAPYGENRHYWKGHFVRELPDELIDELVTRVVGFGRPACHFLIESLHGAPADADGTGAVGFRHAAFNVSVMAVWSAPAGDEEHVRWTRETATALEPWSYSGGGYVNYMQADEPLERVRAAFGAASFDRLRALKSTYDPRNVLRRNQNIPPQEV